MKDRQFHPVSEIFPLLEGEEFEGLKESIRANGQREPIVLHPDGRILDGRNRYRACMALGMEPKTITYTGMGDTQALIDYVLDTNLHRRHLTSSQQAIAAVKADDLLQAERAAAKQRMSDGAKGKQIIADPEKGQVRDRVAKRFKTNHTYVDKARKLTIEAPVLATRVELGEITIPQAERELREQRRQAQRESDAERVKTAAEPTKLEGVYSTIVIDPPWDWGDEGDVNQLGRAKPDYATMPLEEIAALPVGKLAAEDAHLYLWITNRSLPKGFALLEQWGFRYVTCLTWCKPTFGMGNYYRGSTEHLLFGVKGSLQLARHDVGTWFVAQRGKAHSSKPDEAYELIETCSPGPYLDMFSRQQREGWIAWGAGK